jgi:hypothetical protein
MMYGSLYYRVFERRDATIRMIRGLRTEQTEIETLQAERDNLRLPRFDNSRAWIYYKPGTHEVLKPPQSGVPATYEGDWVKDASHCLPPDVRG